MIAEWHVDSGTHILAVCVDLITSLSHGPGWTDQAD